MTREWVNWSGSLRFTPGVIEKPRDEDDLARIVIKAAEDNRIVRLVGAGHSSSPLVQTDDMLVSLEHFDRMESHSLDDCTATIGTGMTVHEAGKAMLDVGLAMHNTGDVDVQTLAGAIATGTHGTGKRLQNLATMLVGVRMVNASGEIVEYEIKNYPDLFCGFRVSLGALGIFTAIRVKLLPKFQLDRHEWCTTIDPVLANLDQLIEENRNLDFYWYPRGDQAKVRILNPPGEGMQDLPYGVLDKEQHGWSTDVLWRKRTLKFDEMEYALPAEAGVACFEEVRKRVKERWRHIVGWRVLYRTVAADDAFLSEAHGRDTVTISLHQNNTLPFWEYFQDIEPIFLAHGGRPHWGKKHTLTAERLKPLYPQWDRFIALRRQFDPDNRFLNSHLHDLLGNGDHAS